MIFCRLRNAVPAITPTTLRWNAGHGPGGDGYAAPVET